MKRLFASIFILLVLVSIPSIFGYVKEVVRYNADKNSPAISKPALTQDSDLLDKSARLGIDVSRLNIFYGSVDIPDAYSEYKYPNTIIIVKGKDYTKTLQLIAHEYYHYEWANIETTDNKMKLGTLLTNFYNADQWLQKRMKIYNDHACTGECKLDELHSIICTEIPNWALDQEFVNYCNSIVPNRSLFIQ